jgi:DNA-binding response OmpR family regulator
MGRVVTAASCVTEAMTNLDPPPLCVLPDIMRPDGDGEEVLRKVRDEGMPTRVVVHTGTDDPVRLAMVRGMDADAMFRKPIHFDEVCLVCEDETLC